MEIVFSADMCTHYKQITDCQLLTECNDDFSSFARQNYPHLKLFSNVV